MTHTDKSYTRIVTAVIAVVAMIMFSSAQAGAQRTDEPRAGDQEWSYANYDDRELLFAFSVDAGDAQTASMLRSMMNEDTLSEAADADVTGTFTPAKDIRKACDGYKVDVSGEPGFVLVCSTKYDVIVVLGTDKNTVQEGAAEIIETGDLEAPEGYEEYDD